MEGIAETVFESRERLCLTLVFYGHAECSLIVLRFEALLTSSMIFCNPLLAYCPLFFQIAVESAFDVGSVIFTILILKLFCIFLCSDDRTRQRI